MSDDDDDNGNIENDEDNDSTYKEVDEDIMSEEIEVINQTVKDEHEEEGQDLLLGGNVLKIADRRKMKIDGKPKKKTNSETTKRRKSFS